ncbi:MAG TPA: metalloregulator ArsR/SmtB family transcription factor [Vicinamibacterales bacterium]
MTSAPVLDQLAVLSDGTRVRMLAVLERQELTVSELCDVLQLPQSTVSRHLRTLMDGAWLTSRREATSRFYAVALDDLPRSALDLWCVVRDQVASTPAAADDARRLRQVLAARRSKSEAFFSSAAGQWDRLRDELFGSLAPLRALFGLFDPRWTVADLGCGTGRATALIAPFIGRVIGVDASPEMLEAARTRLSDQPNVELRQGTLEELPLADREADAAFLLLVLHHVPEPGRVLAEAARVLRPGGRVVIADMLPHDREEYRQTMGHVWLGFADRQIERLLTGAGFAQVRIQPLPPEPKAKGPSLFAAAAAVPS